MFVLHKLCYANYWLGHLSFIGIVVLFVKSFRVYFIVNSKQLKRVKFTTLHAVYLVLGLTSFLISYLSIISILSFVYVETETTHFVNGLIVYHPYCHTKNEVADYLLYSVEGLLLCATLKIAFDTRNIPFCIFPPIYWISDTVGETAI